MSDHELEKIRMKKAEMMMKLQEMPKEIVNIKNSDEFNKLIEDFSDRIVIIDFWAVWCGPCKIFAPIFERLQQEYAQDFIFVKVNTDENVSIAQRFGITGIPTTLFIRNKKVIHKAVGAMNYDYLKQLLDKIKPFNN